MRFGICAPIEYASIVHEAGADYMECRVTDLQPLSPDHEVRDLLQVYKDSPIPIEAFNILLPSSMKLVGNDVNWDEIDRYLSTAMDRIGIIGGKTVVFGCGGGRMCPDSFSKSDAEEQIIAFLRMIGGHAQRNGVTVVIEALSRTISNTINSLTEAVLTAEETAMNAVQILADLYHMRKDGEDFNHIVRYKDRIRHIHLSDQSMAPRTGNEVLNRFTDSIKRSGYDGRISIECKLSDVESGGKAGISFLRNTFAND
ncbi:sugar phosphate isomerase/epimerase [Paenibacillus sp. HB172176]|uniref:sugar phosphate isomerase/epimerase family protein n=1 Tax=Paenibacillus sp. HB172176 TaxID=2493690 RepID=UPI00143B7035|nr:sugar phosphate isomerase/epimerase [Paenibacillus sp. HB172176]